MRYFQSKDRHNYFISFTTIVRGELITGSADVTLTKKISSADDLVDVSQAVESSTGYHDISIMSFCRYED